MNYDARILNFRLVALLESLLPDFQTSLAAIQQSVSPVLRYPDGSLEYDLDPRTQDLWRAWIPRKLLPISISILGCWRSLPPFQPLPDSRSHCFESIEEHEKWLDPIACIQFAPGILQPDYPESVDLSGLQVTLILYRRITRDVRTRIIRTICEWHRSVSIQGVFEEGPVRRISSEIEFQGRRAQFSFDASETGQRTLNWLVISILNGLYGVGRLSAFIFDDVDNLASYGFDLGEEEIIRLPLNDRQDLIEGGAAVASPESHLPEGLIPLPEIQSSLFSLWQTSTHEWETLQLTVYFEGMPNREQQNDFRKLLGSWLIVAQCGGFGGKGAPFFEAPVFLKLKSQKVAYTVADMGDVELDLALPALVRLLENYASGTLGIEAVVFGLNPRTNRLPGNS